LQRSKEARYTPLSLRNAGAVAEGNAVPENKRASTNVRDAVSKELSQLRKKADELRARLDAEIKRREIDRKLLQQAKKAGDLVAAELRVLRQQAGKGATELKKALTDAARREQAHKAAAAKMEQLKAELAKKTAELKQKSTELARLAKETATKAKVILGESSPTPPPSTEPSTASEPAPATTDSTSSERSDR
jgi:chromosome segregation ATPase